MIAFRLASFLCPSAILHAILRGHGEVARWQSVIWGRLVVNWILEKVFHPTISHSKVLYYLSSQSLRFHLMVQPSIIMMDDVASASRCMKGALAMPNHKHLTLDDRSYIHTSLNAGHSFRQIARHLDKDPSTISKEVRHRRIHLSTGAVGRKPQRP